MWEVERKEMENKQKKITFDGTTKGKLRVYGEG